MISAKYANLENAVIYTSYGDQVVNYTAVNPGPGKTHIYAEADRKENPAKEGRKDAQEAVIQNVFMNSSIFNRAGGSVVNKYYNTTDVNYGPRVVNEGPRDRQKAVEEIRAASEELQRRIQKDLEEKREAVEKALKERQKAKTRKEEEMRKVAEEFNRRMERLEEEKRRAVERAQKAAEKRRKYIEAFRRRMRKAAEEKRKASEKAQQKSAEAWRKGGRMLSSFAGTCRKLWVNRRTLILS